MSQMMQYQRNVGNAISAIDSGDTDIARKQIMLAIIAARKNLRTRAVTASAPETVTETTTETITVVESPTPTAQPEAFAWHWSFKPALPSIPGAFGASASRTQVFLVLLGWSIGSALVWNNRPYMESVIFSAATTNTVSGLPVEGRISSPPGWRIHPLTGKRTWHAGTDIAAPLGTPIHATGNGKIMFAGVRGGYGNAVMIDHGNGLITLYGHMQKFASGIKTGAKINKGEIIGTVGSTGKSTGPHVHYETRGVTQPAVTTTATTAFDQQINASAREFGVDPLLVKAVMWKESTFNPSASSGKAHGLMQLTPSTGAMVASQLGIRFPDLYDPETSIRLGTKYLADLQRQFGNRDLVLAAYNAGPGAVRKHRGIPPYPETRNYVQKITGYYNNLKRS